MTTDTGNTECFSKKDGFTFGTTEKQEDKQK